MTSGKRDAENPSQKKTRLVALSRHSHDVIDIAYYIILEESSPNFVPATYQTGCCSAGL